ncbi:hypothetical protein E5329_08995 [Petralouisia muris]|uniref:Uncharacterized protein n=1 Tax=Petralouisia muris TaxID=3032872 RepID=A0AC61RWW8_9FIRM|nr:hypothetical protein E5329_08995 [Petralouisia muris]
MIPPPVFDNYIIPNISGGIYFFSGLLEVGVVIRGINRFCGLQRILTEKDNRYKKIEGIDVYSEWCSYTKIFSEAALEETIEAYKNSNAGLFYQSQGIFEKVLDWSRMVNREIEGLEEKEKTAFDGVKEALSEASKFADTAVVSSANSKAVEEEWHRCGLMDYVDYFMTQEMGSKEECVFIQFWQEKK